MIQTPEKVNIATYLPEMAASHPHKKAVVFPHGRDANGTIAYTHLTFAQLEHESNCLAAGLLAYGLKPGMRTVLMVKPSLPFFSLTFALFKLGAVPVFIDPGMGLKNLKTCLSEADPQAFIGIPKAHVARLLLRWPKVKIKVTVGRGLGFGGIGLHKIREMGSQHRFAMTVPSRTETAAILFTSGSTGVPKGVIYSHGIFDAQVQMLKALYDIQPGEIDLCTFPLFALFAPALGMTAIIPDMDFTKPAHVNPEHLKTAILDFGCTNMFGSPALLNRVGRWAEGKDLSFPTLKRVISAGAPVQAPILRRFCRLLTKNAQVFTPYGATESLPVASIGSAEILAETASLTEHGKGICVGWPAPDVDLHIVKISDQPIEQLSEDLCLPKGEIGELVVTSPSVTRAYFQRPNATALAKMRNQQQTIYHRMGDVGYLDQKGRVWFCGRKAHRVSTSHGDMFTIPVEGVFNAHASIFRSALVGVGKPGDQTPVICLELEPDQTKSNAQIISDLQDLAAKFEHTKGLKHFLFHPGFPVDIRHNAKIFREKLAEWAATKVATR